jgi:hypothetical protein
MFSLAGRSSLTFAVDVSSLRSCYYVARFKLEIVTDLELQVS